jgi:DNA-binding MarR family transcriptional regulator
VSRPVRVDERRLELTAPLLPRRAYRVPMATDDAIRSISESFDGIAIGVRRSARTAAAELAAELQPAAWPVFREVVRSECVQASTIVGTLGMDKSAVSRHLKELREHGLVAAERDEHDARTVWLTPTSTGLTRFAHILDLQQARLQELLAGWPDDDVARFAGLLGRFAGAASAPVR